ncbi:hypothetical protein GCM10011586_27920 [Silvibacterium dinghuense]|nr:hypothetical protein GCM10011586_27920 [Silvibacterium dinghuense]
MACWGWMQYPADYLASSLLSYDAPKSSAIDQSDTATPALADAMLTAEQLDAIAAKAHFLADSPQDGEAGETGEAKTPGQSLRAQLELDQTGPGLLQISLRGQNARSVLDTLNAVSSLLISASPAEDRHDTAPSGAGSIQTSARVDSENLATLQLQESEIRKHMGQLTTERYALEGSDSSDSGTATPGVAANPADAERLRSIMKQLAQLRQERATLQAEEQSLQSRLPGQQSGAGSGAAGKTSSADEQRPVAKGRFSLVAAPDSAHAIPDRTRSLILWGGMSGAVLLAIGYMQLLFLRYRPVRDSVELLAAVPAGTKYFGALAWSPVKGEAR